jgi:Ca2+-binding RTX toxin-like protein
MNHSKTRAGIPLPFKRLPCILNNLQEEIYYGLDGYFPTRLPESAVSFGNGYTLVLEGSGFTYDPVSGDPRSGTITTIIGGTSARDWVVESLSLKMKALIGAFNDSSSPFDIPFNKLIAKIFKGDDLFSSGLNGNIMHGYAGNDVFSGDDGDDTFLAGKGSDTAEGGAGNDVLYGDKGDDRFSGSNGNDTLYGEDNNDLLIGGDGNDSLFGGYGNDTLYSGDSADDPGLSGTDRLEGGDGNDLLIGAGDRLIGGAGRDRFHVGAVYGSLIEDFNVADDTILFSAGPTLAAGRVNASQFVIGSAALDADDRFVYNPGTGFLFFSADGSGGSLEFIAQMAPGLALTSRDFLIV